MPFSVSRASQMPTSRFTDSASLQRARRIERHRTYLGEALSAFGPQRLLWGSDFPLVCAREGYANALQLCWSEFNACSETERAAIFGGVADRLFPPSR